MKMAIIIPVLYVICVTWLFGRAESAAERCRGMHCPTAEQDWSGPCTGTHCVGRGDAAPRPFTAEAQGRHRPGQVYPIYVDANTRPQPHSPPEPYTIVRPQRGGTEGTKRANPRTVTAEVFHPGCAGGNCGSAPATGGESACKGIECRLPLRMRTMPKQQPCVGEGCSAGGREEGGRERSSLIHVTDRAAQFLGEFPDVGSERGGSPLGIQLTCDVKPGSNEVALEDALVLQLRMSQGQEKLVETMQSQQDEIRELQRRLSEQQGALVSQQREILEQQGRMYQQMDQVKTQYSQLLESLKQVSYHSLQGELESHLDTMRSQARAHHTQEAYSVHQVDMEASVMEVGLPLVACQGCGPEEYCGFTRGRPGCERCTVCPAGFFLVSHCSAHSDRICQDRDECLEISNLCGDQQKCINTPGGFRCQDMTEREGGAGMCGHAYFYNSEMEECQACSECEGDATDTPCSFTSDAVCSSSSPSSSSSSSPSSSSTSSDGRLSLAWSGDVTLPPTTGRGSGQSFPNLRLRILGRGVGAAGGSGGLVGAEQGLLVFRQHGLVWLDENMALSHGCRSFVQLCLRLNASDGGNEVRDLSGVRVEQREGRALQSATVSAVAEVAPDHMISLVLRSASHHCNHSSDGLRLHDPSAPPLSLMWLSHDTGAVAMTAQAVASAHYHTNYRPAFRATVTSDAYVVGPTHDGRGVRFAEAGTVRFVFRQALYSMGQSCVSEGFHLLAYLTHNGSSLELGRAFKPGVHYRDTSISLSAATSVDPGDTLAFEVLSPAQCNVRYFGDETGISGVSLVWVPAIHSSSMQASVARSGLPSGAVRNKPLLFRQTGQPVAQMGLGGGGGRDFLFRERGTASVSLDLKLIHSCSLVKVTLLRRAGGGGAGGEGGRPVPLGQQVGGQMVEGSQWASLALRASFPVQNATAVFFTLDCVRGRVNQISHQAGSGVSVLWVAV